MEGAQQALVQGELYVREHGESYVREGAPAEQDPDLHPDPDPVPTLPATPVVLRGDGLVLREWAEGDLPAMAELFDEPGIAHRTPLASPFDLAAARAYLDRARSTRADGTRLQLVVTEDGVTPLGEVLLASLGAERPAGAVTLGYAIGAAHRGRRLALRATRLLTEYAHTTLGLHRLRLQIEADNAASTGVARAAGYRLRADVPPTEVTQKGRTYTLQVWEHEG
ncbi:GNAT family N-acetyltransferase [Streptomyces sp. LHD-70]|uniref:GNAT family N-acetyltransferase n=1 Tax=Streptomyces sp. LHD-70 TaxID=3072140 RepID=UPI00280D25BC|nr:GNAT family N-acetyltransferase [Streptomyces sp. LHD-70]MDQ8705756.1 GNAT family N-acetyltransferase [Streptomyces sp. LHD-70]